MIVIYHKISQYKKVHIKMQKQQSHYRQKSQAKTQYLNQIIEQLQENDFIDLTFEHNYNNIYGQSTEQKQLQQVIWMPCEQLHHKPYYSNGQFSLKQIENMNFVSWSVNETLVIMKYFVENKFAETVSKRSLGYQCRKDEVIQHCYLFEDLYIGKQLRSQFIDSYVPVSEVRNKEMFAQNKKGCIFPCLIEKLLAKLSSGYHLISHKYRNVTTILQLLTSYPIEKIHTQSHEPIILTNTIKQNFLHCTNPNLLFFKTRNNKKLESFGIYPNQTYLIVGLIQKQTQSLVAFLQMKRNTNKAREVSQGKQIDDHYTEQIRWVGKWSRYRINAKELQQLQSELTQHYRISKQLLPYINFMTVGDLYKLCSSLVTLHNTQNYIKSSKTFTFYSSKTLPNTQQIMCKDKQNPSSLTSIQHHSTNDFNDQIKQQKITEPLQSMVIASKIMLIWGMWDAKIQRTNQLISESIQSSSKNNEKILIDLNITLSIDHENKDSQAKSDSQQPLGSSDTSSDGIFHLTILMIDSKNNVVHSTNIDVKFKQHQNLSFCHSLLLKILKEKILSSQSAIQHKLIVLLNTFSPVPMIFMKNEPMLKIAMTQFIHQTEYNLDISMQPSLSNQFTSLINKLTEVTKCMLFQSQTFLLPQKQSVQIVCKQFINKLSLGIIHIQIPLQKVNQNIQRPEEFKLSIEINNPIMIRQKIWFMGYDQSKNNDQNLSISTINQITRLNIVLTRSNSWITLLFYVNPLKLSTVTKQKSQKSQFPPENSIKINQVFQAHI